MWNGASPVPISIRRWIEHLSAQARRHPSFPARSWDQAWFARGCEFISPEVKDPQCLEIVQVILDPWQLAWQVKKFFQLGVSSYVTVHDPCHLAWQGVEEGNELIRAKLGKLLHLPRKVAGVENKLDDLRALGVLEPLSRFAPRTNAFWGRQALPNHYTF